MATRAEQLERAREARERVSMKLSKAEVKKHNAPMAVGASSAPRYPWGLSLSLDNASLEKLGMTKLPEVGATFELDAKVKVTSVSQNEDGSSSNRSASLQITEMCLEPLSRRTARRKE